MGTKRALAPTVRAAIESLEVDGRVADLFSGMGSVATSMASSAPVLTNDALGFTTAFARARFLQDEHAPARDVATRLFPHFRVAHDLLRADFRARISRERNILAADRQALVDLMARAPHAGNSDRYARLARQAAASTAVDRYRLATLYFSAGYFSTAQAAQLDALRYAIDQVDTTDISGDWLLAAWLAAAAVVMNAPGHSAQFLKPGNDAVYARIRRQWQRSIWSVFVEQLDAIQPVGTKRWRATNRVCNADALTLVCSSDFDGVSIVYADPPYTRDHYSRFYHVHETLYRYDFPDSYGAGRTRSDQFHTTFSAVRHVEEAFRSLFSSIAARGLPLVLSYPEDGLLNRAGVKVARLIEEYFSVRSAQHFALEHSTLGASSGARTKAALEGVYVCVP